MKKVLIFLLAVALAVTSMAIVIPASAAPVLKGDADLLAASGLGNPAAMKEANTNLLAETWVGHESWNGNEGWDGFRGGDNKSTREIISSTLSDGSDGYVLRFANDTSGISGSELAIENIDKICGFEKGQSYVAIVTAKVKSGFGGNGNAPYVAFNAKGGDNAVAMTADGKWHTYISKPYLYSDETLTGGDGKGAHQTIS